MKISIKELRQLISEAFSELNESLESNQEEFQDAVEELMGMPEYANIDVFAEYKFDDDQETYDAVELQALARNMYLNEHPEIEAHSLATAPNMYREKVKNELAAYGLRFSPRQAVKKVRGVSDPFHGSNRYAGNAGGSGFEGIRAGHDKNDTPHAGGRWDPNRAGTLGMGSKKK